LATKYNYFKFLAIIHLGSSSEYRKP